ncbi:lipopolysaccharide biosynthesis protein [Rossellomorea marisflavi]|uniref:lipopolysaccharide biosynthesis protein n=1 Tax=Rossellomorea marisflavi TaxID=189381 RepID=UPI0034587301
MNFLKKLLSFSIGSFGSGIIAFVSIPFLTRVLSPEEYGSGMLFISVAMVFSNISILGLDQSYARFYDRINPRILLKKISFITFFSIIVLSLIVIINKSFINSFFNNKYEYAYLLILFMFTQNLFRYTLVILRMEQKGYLFSLLYIGQRLTELIFLVIFISLFSAIHLYMIFSSILGFILPSIIGIFILNQLITKRSELSILETSVESKSLLKFGVPLMMSTVLITILLNIDKVILSFFVSNFELGIYTSALQIALSLNIIQSAFNSFWVPYAYTVSQEENFKEKFNIINIFLTLIMVVVAIILIHFKGAFSILLGKEFKDSINLIPMLVLMPVFYTLSETVSIGINLYKKSYLHLRISLFVLIFQTIILVILIKNFNTLGASISVGSSFLLLYVLRLFTGQKHLNFIKNTKILFTIIITLYSYALVESFYDNAIISIMFIVFMLFMLFILLKKNTKFITSQFRRKV